MKQKLTDEIIADVAAQYPRIGKLTTADIDDEIAGRIIRDIANQELCEQNGWRYWRGQWCIHATDAQITAAVWRWWNIIEEAVRPCTN